VRYGAGVAPEGVRGKAPRCRFVPRADREQNDPKREARMPRESGKDARAGTGTRGGHKRQESLGTRGKKNTNAQPRSVEVRNPFQRREKKS